MRRAFLLVLAFPLGLALVPSPGPHPVGSSGAFPLAVDVALPAARYPDERTRQAAYDRLLAAVHMVPGVKAAMNCDSVLNFSLRNSLSAASVSINCPWSEASCDCDFCNSSLAS